MISACHVAADNIEIARAGRIGVKIKLIIGVLQI